MIAPACLEHLLMSIPTSVTSVDDVYELRTLRYRKMQLGIVANLLEISVVEYAKIASSLGGVGQGMSRSKRPPSEN